jgi:hypothetical protein
MAPERSVGLLWAGLLGGPAFVVAYTVEGARRPGYDPRRHPVSSLALGPRGWVQRTSFTALGLSFLGLSRGLRKGSPMAREKGQAPVIAAAGLGLLLSAAAQTDPVSGYPPGTPAVPAQPTREGAIHDLGALPVFLGIPAYSLISAVHAYRGGRPRWAAWSAASGGSALVALGLSIAAFGQKPSLVRWGGLFQRAAIMSCLGWVASSAGRALLRR